MDGPLNLALKRRGLTYTIDLPPATPTRFEVSRRRTEIRREAGVRRSIPRSAREPIHQPYGDSASFDSPTLRTPVLVDGRTSTNTQRSTR